MSEISVKNKYDWDLESLLSNGSLESLFNDWVNKKNKIIDSYPTFLDSKENFINWTKINHDFGNCSNKLINYVSNKLNENIIDQKWVNWSQKISNELHDLDLKTHDSNNKVLKNEKKVNEYLKDDFFKEYIREYKLFFKSKKHILSEKEEKLLSHLSLNDSGYEEVFSTLTDSNIKYEKVLDKNNKLRKINSIADVNQFLKSKDRTLRKNTWYSFHNAYFKFKETLSLLLYYNYLTLNTNAEIRNYKDYVDSCCDSDEITVNLILSIYKNVEMFKDVHKKFFSKRNSLLKKIYNIENIEPWDKSLDLNKKNVKYSIEQSKQIVLKALSCFGDEYLEVVKQAFDQRWISWNPKENKYSGAYSIGGTRGLNKYYILMNFDSTMSSIYTLIHELGHSIHSYYFGKSQKVHASCKIFYAEIASITNEIILSLYLLEKLDNNYEKLNILDELLTGFFSTTTRQIIFSNFEYEIVNKIKNKESITFDVIKDVYIKMNEKYTGSNSKNMSSKKYECALSTILRISHFYSGNFYVYKYAIGQIIGIICGYKIFNKDKEFIKKYFLFLKSGSSLSPLDTIKLLGLDLNDQNVYVECQKILNKFINLYNDFSEKIQK